MLFTGRDMQGARALLIALTLVTAAAGCETARAPGSPTQQNLFAEAERLLHERQFAAAARLYESLATQAAPERRDGYWVRAARAWLRADDLLRSQRALQQVSSQPPDSELPQLRLALAEMALLDRRPERALAELERIPQPYPRELAAEVLRVRAQAQFAYGKPVGGVITALDRERLLSDPAEIARNRQLIWDGIQRGAAAGVDMRAPSGVGRMAAGWLELGRVAVALARNPYVAQTTLNEWRTQYPDHPANEFITEIVLPQLHAESVYPSDIALLLPLTGRAQASGIAVRDGFIAGYLQQPRDTRPTLRIYDTTPGVVAAYAKAVSDGAKFVVGPLTKSEVAILLAQPLTVPTLVLNESPDAGAATPNRFEFWPDPTDEARQVAARATAEGQLSAVALLPNDEWGQRLFKAFESELRARGGTVVSSRFYDPTTIDFSKPVAEALLVSESQARFATLQQTIGGKLHFEPRVRGDVQFVFIAVRDPQKGRLLRPALRAYLPAAMPIYATSDIYEPASNANAELNGIIFPDMPWMITPDDVSTQLRATLQKYWPARERERSRLYAFGFDAYRLIPRLQTTAQDLRMVGLTGRLALDNTGRIQRDLDWARMVEGKVQAAGPLLVPEVTTDRP